MMTEPPSTYRLGGYQEFPPPASFLEHLECLWTFARGEEEEPIPGAGHRVLPDAGLSLCFDCRRGRGGRVVMGEVVVMGPIRTTRFFRPEPGLRIDAIRIRPEWALPLLGVAPADVVDRILPLRSLVKFDRLRGRLLETRTRWEALRVLVGFAEGRIAASEPPGAVRLAHRGLQHLTRVAPDPPSVRVVARQLKVSERHLRRVITSLTGASPKIHQRIRRLGAVVAAADRSPGSPNWSRLAIAAGYFDQAHLIHDCRDFVGLTPLEVYRERRLQVGSAREHRREAAGR